MLGIAENGDAEVLEHLSKEFQDQSFHCPDCKAACPTQTFMVNEPMKTCGGWVSHLEPGTYKVLQLGGSGASHGILLEKDGVEIHVIWADRDMGMIDWRAAVRPS